ncbi:hypothetical protein ABIE49_001121 [Bradyrhizobium sp. OAE829]
MKMVTIVVALYLGTCSFAFAQSSTGGAAGSRELDAFEREHYQRNRRIAWPEYLECAQPRHDRE